MWKIRFGTLALLALLAACVQLPPTPQDIQGKKFESAPPGHAVIYLVRTNPDWGDLPATVFLDDRMMGATFQGTYFRWEVPAGRHQITGFASDNGRITLDLQAGRTYFVQHVVLGGGRVATPNSHFRVIDEKRGRAAVLDGVLAGWL